MNVNPCIHPTCDDGTGNKALTTQRMCDRCRRHYRREIDWLVIDYVTLKATLANPTSTTSGVRGSAKSFGHPAEWASDRCAEIAGVLNEAEDRIRELRTEGPAIYVAPEHVKVAKAYRYLTDRWDDFCTFDDADEFAEGIHETHKSLRRSMGHARTKRRLPIPCLRCDIQGFLFRDDSGTVECTHCGRVYQPEHFDYELLVRSALDGFIDAYEALNTP